MPVFKEPATWNCWRVCFWATWAAILASATAVSASPLVTSERAGRYSLARMWFAQVNVDAGRGRVTQWTLHRDQLFSLSTSGTLQSLNAETGETLWTVRIGAPDGVFAGPAVNSQVVALTSGTRLYVLDRKDGHLLWTKQLGGAGAAAPALSERFAFVGLMNGMLEGFSLESRDEPIWYHQSVGRIFNSATVTGEVVCWPTDRGFLYVAQADQPRVLFRVETNEEIVAAPAEWAPYLYVPSRDGYLYCLHELSGAEIWRVSTGFPIVSQPAAVRDQVFVASEEPALHAVQGVTGKRLWTAVGAMQFATLGAKQIYGMDRFGGLMIMEKATGGLIGRLPMAEGTTALVNDQSDRIYLVSATGLVQCLRERGAVEPTYYREEKATEPVPPQEDAEETPFVEETPAQAPTPPQDFAEPEEEPAAPAEPAEDTGEADEDENPFF
jgi:hypothetical protein